MIGVLNTTNAIIRSSLCSISNLRNVSTHAYPLCFRISEALLGEPLKRKKRLDPAIIRAREDRKKRKIEKRIRMLEKHAHHMKPVFEIDGIIELLKNKDVTRHLTEPLSKEEIDRRKSLEKEWVKYKQNEWLEDLRVIKSIMTSQERALKELKAVSTELYKKALEFDDSYLPYTTMGPVHTPPISNYDSPDGEYIDTTIKYPGE
ncbi:mitochondrial ribosomal protein L40 [Xylocopa sonorina]|uniref:mitochondrial ribosomal protein L40 n=1 Tax=Xylocopa sonorina TaxID=1818115 RepID=UPI00403AD495